MPKINAPTRTPVFVIIQNTSTLCSGNGDVNVHTMQMTYNLGSCSLEVHCIKSPFTLHFIANDLAE